MTLWRCSHCKKIIVENVEESKIEENWIECPYCGRWSTNPQSSSLNKFRTGG